MTSPEPPSEQRMSEPPVAPRAGRGGVVRIVLGIVIIVLVVLGTLGNAASGQAGTSGGGGVAEELGTVFGRLLFLAIGIVLLVSGIRARGRAR